MTTTKHLTNVEIKDATKGIVTAVISTFGVIDSDGDVTSKSTFTDGAPVVVSAYGHTSWQGDLPIGKGVLTTTDSEAIAELQFFMDIPHAKAAFDVVAELSKAGLQEWSYSLEGSVVKVGELDGQRANFIESTTVKEVSPVLRGASVNTRTLAVKSDGVPFVQHIESVLAEVDALTDRATAVLAVRAEKGKTLGEESAAKLKQLRDRLTSLVDPEPDTQDTDTDLKAQLNIEYLRLVRSSQGDTPEWNSPH
jgi:hypothetical protein